MIFQYISIEKIGTAGAKNVTKCLSVCASVHVRLCRHTSQHTIIASQDGS